MTGASWAKSPAELWSTGYWWTRLNSCGFSSRQARRGLEQLSPIVWRSNDNEGVFIVDHPTDTLPFICMFLQADEEHVAPQIMFDQGKGYDELTAVAFRSFPFGFYHVSLATRWRRPAVYDFVPARDARPRFDA